MTTTHKYSIPTHYVSDDTVAVLRNVINRISEARNTCYRLAHDHNRKESEPSAVWYIKEANRLAGAQLYLETLISSAEANPIERGDQ